MEALRDQLFADGRQARSLDLDAYHGPLLVIWGAEDAIIPAAHAEAAPSRAEVHVLDGVGHSPHMEAAGRGQPAARRVPGRRARRLTGGEKSMLLPKTMIVEQLRARGDTEGAERADRELGEKVDTEQDADLLASLDVDAAKLADDFDGQSPAVG